MLTGSVEPLAAKEAAIALEIALRATNTARFRWVPLTLLTAGNGGLVIPRTLIAVTIQTLALCLLPFPLFAAQVPESTACRRTLPAMTTGKMTSDSSTGSVLQAATGLSLRYFRDSTQAEQYDHSNENSLSHKGNSSDQTRTP